MYSLDNQSTDLLKACVLVYNVLFKCKVQVHHTNLSHNDCISFSFFSRFILFLSRCIWFPVGGHFEVSLCCLEYMYIDKKLNRKLSK